MRAPRARLTERLTWHLITPQRREILVALCVALRPTCNTDSSVAERRICDFAAGPLPAHHRRIRRKYVRVGSYAASMPRKVPRR
ncbi:hypothetical protein XarbCFBP8130_13880 [Xanthomonas arboricola]|nr:hypothetical protein XarbCFBP8130_13880 [Xanthomonas arboricola]